MKHGYICQKTKHLLDGGRIIMDSIPYSAIILSFDFAVLLLQFERRTNLYIPENFVLWVRMKGRLPLMLNPFHPKWQIIQVMLA